MGHSVLASRPVLCLRVPRGKPRFTLVSDGNPLRLLLEDSWKEVALHGDSPWVDLPVTPRWIAIRFYPCPVVPFPRGGFCGSRETRNEQRGTGTTFPHSHTLPHKLPFICVIDPLSHRPYSPDTLFRPPPAVFNRKIHALFTRSYALANTYKA